MQIANILRLLFSGCRESRELGAQLAYTMGYGGGLYRQLENRLQYWQILLHRKFYLFSETTRRKIINYIDDLQSALIFLLAERPKEFWEVWGRERQIFVHAYNNTFKYRSMQCRETPKNTASLVYQLGAYDFNYLVE